MKRRTFLSTSIGAMLASRISVAEQKGSRWGYGGDIGPDCWGGLDPAWSACARGHEQSPISLPESAPGEDSFSIQYQEGPGIREAGPQHVQATLGKGSSMLLDGRHFDLVQFHFHAPSEHFWHGSAAVAEVHLVHADPEGGLSVLGVALKEESSWDRKPAWWDDFVSARDGEPVTVNPADLLPGTDRFLRYDGSLTTPPCTEGVRWLLASELLPVDREAIGWLKEILAGNARPVQPQGARSVVGIKLG